MKAIVCVRYGSPDVLRPREIAKPVPRDKEVLIRVRATTVTAGDRRMRAFDVPSGMRLAARLALGVFRPWRQILGTELAGEIEAVGSGVTRFAAGDRVFAFPGARVGSYAEYRCMAEDGAVAGIPDNLTFEEAAVLPFGGATALDFFRKAELKAGEEILVIGASGGVGTAAVQLASHAGAIVTGVCSTGNVELVRSLGATTVIDYTREDIVVDGDKSADGAGIEGRYDVIMDTVGSIPAESLLPLLKRGGRLLLVAAGLREMLRTPGKARRSGKRSIAGPAAERPEDLRHLADLVRSGAYTPVIDRRYTLEQIVEAHRYVDTGRKKGNVVVTVPS